MWTRVFHRALLATLCLLISPHSAAVVDELRFESPVSGAVIEAGTLPVLGRLPMDYRFHTAELFVDGALVESTPVVVRRRWWEGKGVDLIASIDTTGLSPGPHQLTAVLAPTEKGRRIIESNDAGAALEISTSFTFQPRPHRVTFRVEDGDGDARFARVQIFNSDGTPVDLGSPQDAAADPSKRDSPRNSLFVPPSGSTEFLSPGEYRVLASGGIRDGVDDREISIYGSQNLVLKVPAVIETPGVLSADLHVHTAASSDAFVPDTQRFRSLAAADIDVAVISDHNRLRDPIPALKLLGMSDAISTITGVEFRVGKSGESIGHGNAFPLLADAPAVRPGDRPPAEVFDAWRQHAASHPVSADGGPPLIQLNHPRGIQFDPDKEHRFDAHGLFSELSFDATKSLADQSDSRLRKLSKLNNNSVLSVDAIEVLNRFSIVGWRAVRADWFALLNRGHRITGTGNADSHSLHLEPVGFPVNLVDVSQTGPGGFTDSIRSGRVAVSSGPIVSMVVVDGTEGLLPVHDLRSVSGQVEVVIRVQAPGWVPVEEMRLIVNGQVVHRQPLGSLGADKTWRYSLELVEDAWLLAEAGWPLYRDDRPTGTVYAKVAPGHVPIGFTNPIWLDANGDGRFSFTAGQVGPKLQVQP